jgi:plasmid stabilization system protein ParE
VSAPYLLTAEAQAHIDEIGAYIAQDNVDAALKVYDAFEEAFVLLGERPGLGHSREDLTDRPLRFWSVFSYLVVYDPESRPLTIIAVLHGARDVEKLLKR